jgi:hypothetical protein
MFLLGESAIESLRCSPISIRYDRQERHELKAVTPVA